MLALRQAIKRVQGTGIPFKGTDARVCVGAEYRDGNYLQIAFDRPYHILGADMWIEHTTADATYRIGGAVLSASATCRGMWHGFCCMARATRRMMHVACCTLSLEHLMLPPSPSLLPVTRPSQYRFVYQGVLPEGTAVDLTDPFEMNSTRVSVRWRTKWAYPILRFKKVGSSVLHVAPVPPPGDAWHAP